MNVYLDIALFVARALVLWISAIAVRHGWVTADHAHAITGAATLWVAAGIGAAGLAIWKGIRHEVKTSATISLAKSADPSTSAGHLWRWTRPDVQTFRSLWLLAKNLQRELQANQAAAKSAPDKVDG